MKQLVITDLEPKDAPLLNTSLRKQGHKIVMAFYREEGMEDPEPRLTHISPEMLSIAVIEAQQKKTHKNKRK